MKVLVQTVEKDDGFCALMGERIEVYCGNYIYVGKLVGVNSTCIKLQNASIVYETGNHLDKTYKDAQLLGHDQYLQTAFIESFGVTTKK
jgi:hypothetical protein